MNRDDDPHRFAFHETFSSFGNRRKASASTRAPASVRKPSAKDREIETLKSQLRIKSRKQQLRKRTSELPSDPDARPRKSMLKKTRELLADYPDISIDKLMWKLERLGYQAAPVTIVSIARDFRETIRIAEARGYIKVLD